MCKKLLMKTIIKIKKNLIFEEKLKMRFWNPVGGLDPYCQNFQLNFGASGNYLLLSTLEEVHSL